MPQMGPLYWVGLLIMFYFLVGGLCIGLYYITYSGLYGVNYKSDDYVMENLWCW